MKVNKISLSDAILSKSSLNKKFKDLTASGAIINAEIFSSGNKFSKQTLFFNKKRILSQDEFLHEVKDMSQIQVFDFSDKLITPALVDQHIHGGFGIDFNNADESQMRNFLKRIKNFAQGSILATLVPGTIQKLNMQMDIIRNIIRFPDQGASKILGINLEGPFFSPKNAGIHPPEILLKPTVDNLKKLNLEDVKMLTIAPELDEGYKATEYLNSLGVITSAGHSAASAKQVRDSKVKQVTHLFNAMSGFHHRIPTIANEGLMNDEIYAEVNTALELLDPKTLDLIMRVKPQDKIILISDALSGSNIEENYFIMGGKRIDIDENGIAKDKDGILAGSLKFLGQAAGKLINNTQMTFADFIKFASQNPAKNLGIESEYKLAEGTSPNFVIWDKKTLLPEKTFIKGE